MDAINQRTTRSGKAFIKPLQPAPSSTKSRKKNKKSSSKKHKKLIVFNNNHEEMNINDPEENSSVRILSDDVNAPEEAKKSDGISHLQNSEDRHTPSPPLLKKETPFGVIVPAENGVPEMDPEAKDPLSDHKKFHCPFCNQGFARKYDMEKHSRKHTGVKPYKCGVCGRRFVQVGSLAVHMRSHTGEMPYQCEACGKGFAVKERLRLHSRTHTGERPYQCEHCEKRFARGGQLMVHRRIHTGDKPYSCTSCDLKFTSSGNLKTHMKLHVGTREYQCHLCDKAYPRADTLKRHILAFHENKRLYKCDVCNKSFKGHIRDHMRTHAEDKDMKPYGCNQCGSRFNQRSQLTVHMRVHTGERPYICKICSRSFSHSTALKLHMRMHTGERPHSCKLCKKSFSQLPHLKKHMLCVHNTDKPYFCEKCDSFFKTKNEYQEHAEKDHPGDIPEDLVGIANPGDKSQNETDKISDVQCVTLIPISNNSPMPMEKMRTLLALLLKKISTPGRLKKLGFGTRLIDEVLKESIQASGRTPFQYDEDIEEYEVLKKNIKILLDWTIPPEYIDYFKSENKSVEDILEELTS